MKKMLICILFIVFIYACRFVNVFADEEQVKITIINDNNCGSIYDEDKKTNVDSFECVVVKDYNSYIMEELNDNGTSTLSFYSLDQLVGRVTIIPKEGYVFTKWIINGVKPDLYYYRMDGFNSRVKGDIDIIANYLKDTTFYWGLSIDNIDDFDRDDYDTRYKLLISETKEQIPNYEQLKNYKRKNYYGQDEPYPLAGETNGIFIDYPVWNDLLVIINDIEIIGKIYAPSTAHWFNYLYMYDENGNPTNITIDFSGLNGVEDTSYMFVSCDGVDSICLIGFDTSKAKDMTCMFDGCYNTKKICFDEKFDTKNVLSFCAMFKGCNNLASIDGVAINTSNAIDISNMFVACRELTQINTSQFDTSNVINMDYLFSFCVKLTELDVSHFDTSKVTSMNSMFYECNRLEKLDVSHFNTSNVTNMYYMFEGCSNLKELDVSCFDTSNVTSMMYMFGGCSSLEKLDVSGFDTSKVETFDSLFSGCSSLKELDLTSFTFNDLSVQTGGYMFTGDINLETIYANKDFYLESSTPCFGYVMYSGSLGDICYKLKGEDGSYIIGYDESTGQYVDEDNKYCIYHQVGESSVNATYARVDDLANNKPGYFTRGYHIIYKYDDGTKKSIVGKIGTEIELEKLEKDGYIFIGWNDGINTFTDSYILSNEDVILNPIWERVPSQPEYKPSNKAYSIPQTGIK